MNDKVKELTERVKLTGEEANRAFDDAFDKPVEFDHKPTPEEIITLRLLAVAQAATDKVLNDPDLALIDREGYRKTPADDGGIKYIFLAEALRENSKNAEKRHCSECGWEGLENETGFGHDDFYCPICLKETLDICEVKQ